MRSIEITIVKLKERQTALSTSVNNYQKQEEEIQAKIKDSNKDLKKLEKQIEKSKEEYDTLGIKEAQAIKGKEKAEEKYKAAQIKLEELTDNVNDAIGVLNILNKNIGKANKEIESTKARKAKAIEKYYVEIRESCKKIEKLVK